MEVFTRRSRALIDSHSLASDLAQMRIQSNRSTGLSQYIWLAFRCGLTYRLHSLASQIRAVKMRMEVRWVALRFYLTTDKGFIDINRRATGHLSAR